MTKTKPHQKGCRVCGETNQRLRRGLCAKHYERFNRKLRSLPENEQQLFEEICISDGWVDAIKPPGRPKPKDVFDEIADQVTEGTQQAAEAKATYAEDKQRKPLSKRASKKKSS